MENFWEVSPMDTAPTIITDTFSDCKRSLRIALPSPEKFSIEFFGFGYFLVSNHGKNPGYDIFKFIQHGMNPGGSFFGGAKSVRPQAKIKLMPFSKTGLCSFNAGRLQSDRISDLSVSKMITFACIGSLLP